MGFVLPVQFTGEAPSATWNNDQGSDPYTVGGFGPRSGYYGQAAGQAAGPLTFGGASAATSMAAPRQQRPVWAAAGGYYNGTQVRSPFSALQSRSHCSCNFQLQMPDAVLVCLAHDSTAEKSNGCTTVAMLACLHCNHHGCPLNCSKGSN